jgi:RHS repeat-associated protein
MTGTSSTNPFQYIGREMDPTGLYFMRARYYNPIAQRFISPDPVAIARGRPDLYAYPGNDPTSPPDPTSAVSLAADTVSEPAPAISPPPPPAPADALGGSAPVEGIDGNFTFALLQDVDFALERMVPSLRGIKGLNLTTAAGRGPRFMHSHRLSRMGA